MVMHLFIIILVFLADLTDALSRTKCFECKDVPHPYDCLDVVICGEGQICLTEQIITSSGFVLYNTGCKSRQNCFGTNKRNGPRKISKRNDITTCDDCCEGDFCNNEGCLNTAPKQPKRGPICYTCAYEANPEMCRKVSHCDVGQVCMLTQMKTITQDGQPLYQSSCQVPEVCEALRKVGKKRYNFCHKCCTDDFCNDECLPNTPPATLTTEKTTVILPTATPNKWASLATQVSTASSTTNSTTTTIPTTTTQPTIKTTTRPKTTTQSTIKTTTRQKTTTQSTIKTTRPKTTIVSQTTATTPLTSTTRTRPTTTQPTIKTTTKAQKTTTAPSTTVETTTTTRPTTTQPKVTTSSQKAMCEQRNYTYHANSNLCYKFHVEHKTWDEGNDICKKEGGTLAIIDTSEKWEYLRDQLQHSSDWGDDTGTYIGLKNLSPKPKVADFKWTDGQSAAFVAWDNDEPDKNVGSCVFLLANAAFKWHDASCFMHNPFICTKNI